MPDDTQPPYTPDTTLLDLNSEIEAALRGYISDDVDVIFELPSGDEAPAVPTVSVFLYDIQEDLQIRHSEMRPFTGGKLLPGYVHMRCCYLVTYWDTDSGATSAAYTGPASQAQQMMNKVMNALLNNRSFASLSAYTRIMPPAEHLNSLGNFWQSLGNKPRLALSYMVTVPIRLRDRDDTRVEVKTTEANLEQLGGS